MVTMEDDEAIFVQARMFLEEMCYQATNFILRRHGKGFHDHFYIVLQKTSWELLPMHAFNLISVSEFVSGHLCAQGIIGVFFFFHLCCVFEVSSVFYLFKCLIGLCLSLQMCVVL